MADEILSGSSGNAGNGSAPRRGARRQAGPASAPDLPTFDAALTQLEETVHALEDGHLPLDEAVALFERGIQLAQTCQEVLDHAELRVRQLVATQTESGALVLETLEFEGES